MANEKNLLAAACVVIAGCGQDVLIRTAKTCTLDTSSLGVVEEIEGGPTACARYSSGQVWCWGDNAAGQLGNPDGYPESNVPVRVLDVDCVAELGLGCARRQTGGVWCWGYVGLDAGEGGFGAVRIPHVESAVQVGPVDALEDDGEVWFWGDWHWAMPVAREPIQWPALGKVAALPRHGMPRCFVTPERTVRCFGWNAWGEVGDGTTDPRIEPVDVVGLSDVVELTVGNGSVAALLGDGTVAAWGFGDGAGVGHTGNVLVPEQVVTADRVLTDLVQVSLSDTGCALRRDKTVWCWGDTGQGDLRALVATPISGLGPAIQVAAGGAGGCALLEDRTVWCWGDNSVGQLGDGGYEDFSPEPVQVALPAE